MELHLRGVWWWVGSFTFWCSQSSFSKSKKLGLNLPMSRCNCSPFHGITLRHKNECKVSNSEHAVCCDNRFQVFVSVRVCETNPPFRNQALWKNCCFSTNHQLFFHENFDVNIIIKRNYFKRNTVIINNFDNPQKILKSFRMIKMKQKKKASQVDNFACMAGKRAWG